MSDQKNKRAMPRFPLHVPVTVKNGENVIESTTRDVSANGVFVYLPTEVHEGDTIEFNLTLPQELTLAGSIDVTCRGKVVRVSHEANGRMGVAATIESYTFAKPASAATV